MKKIKFCSALIILFCEVCMIAGYGALAADMKVDEEMIVSAHRRPQPLWRSGVATDVIGAEEIDRLGRPPVSELLRLLPGVDVVATGGAAGQTSVFLRGMESDHVSLIIDGVPMNSPWSGSVDFASLSSHDIERIELLRGPQSALYGAGALGGVIHIITRSPDEAKDALAGSAMIESGTRDSSRALVNLRRRWNRLGLNMNAEVRRSDGFSHAIARYTPPMASAPAAEETDGDLSRHISARAGWRFNEDMAIRLLARYASAHADLDDYTLAAVDDPDYERRWRDQQWRVEADLPYAGTIWRGRVSFDYRRRVDSFENGPLADDSFSDNTGNSIRIARTRWSWENAFDFDDQRLADVGLSVVREQAETSASNRTRRYSAWAQYQQPLWRFLLSAGARAENHDVFGGHADYRLTGVLPLAGRSLRLRASLSSGHRIPSIGDLYSSFGSPDLQPERARAWDVGVAWEKYNWTLSWTRFRVRLYDRIDYDFAARKLRNAGNASSNGHELSAAYAGKDWNMVTGYTVTNARDSVTGARLLRRPRHKAQVRVYRQLSATLGIGATGRYVGKRDDLTGILPTHTTVDAHAYWRLTGLNSSRPHWRLEWRVTNLLDRRYQEPAGYHGADRAVFMALRADL